MNPTVQRLIAETYRTQYGNQQVNNMSALQQAFRNYQWRSIAKDTRRKIDKLINS